MQKIKDKDIATRIEKARENLIIVEGKKDKSALQQLDFKNIFVINETGHSLYEKIEQVENIANKDGDKKSSKKICILTDFDKKGKKLYLMLKKELSVKNVKMDNSLRALFLKMGTSHIEGIKKILDKNLDEKDENKKTYQKRNSHFRDR